MSHFDIKIIEAQYICKALPFTSALHATVSSLFRLQGVSSLLSVWFELKPNFRSPLLSDLVRYVATVLW
jgi:hypothetical protein